MPRRKKRSTNATSDCIEAVVAEETTSNIQNDDFLEGVSRDTCIVKSSPQVGRYLVSKKRLKEGDTILIDEPLVVGPCQDTDTVCVGCCSLLNTSIKYSHRCGGCGWPVCGGGCTGLKNDLSHGGHTQAECIILNKWSEELTSSCFNILTPLRCLLIRQLHPEVWSKISRMESHNDIRKDIPAIWTKNHHSVVEPIMKIYPDSTEELIHTICGILEVNCFSVGGDGVEARALYPTAYLFQHDCTPNTSHIDSESFTMTVRASIDIQQSTPITLCYTSTLHGTQRRRRDLKESKFFDCCCPRCSSKTELGTYLSAVRCNHCGKGWLLPEQPLVENSQWKCKECQQSVHYSYPVNLTERSSSDFEALKDGSVEDYEKLIHKYDKLLHPNHSTMIRIKYSLSQMYGKTEEYLLGDMSPSMLQRKYDICNDLLKVFDIIEPGMSRVRGVTLYEGHAPLLMLTQITAAYGGITQKDMKRDLRKVKGMLMKSVAILSVERPDTSEGRLYEAAKEALEQTHCWPV